MGQTVNPTIFRLGKTKNWPSKYLAKKTSDTSIYAFKDLEIKKFVYKFFQDNGLTVSNCKINYSDDGSLHLFVSYYLTLKTVSLINNLIGEQKIRLIRIKNRKSRKNKKKQTQLKKSLKSYYRYRTIKNIKFLKNNIERNNSSTTIEKLFSKNQNLQRRRMRLLKSYKDFITAKKSVNFESVTTNYFLTKFFDSLHLFLNKNIKVFLTLQQLNQNIIERHKKYQIAFLKKNLIKLRKYKQHQFFREGLNIMFLSSTKNHKASLLAHFIATHLSKAKKKHNLLLKFLQATLTLFTNNKFSHLHGMKIKISGRLNGRPRARNKIILIGDGVPAITLNSNLDYAESTAFTPNGTLGIKVWICNKNF